MKKIVLLLLAFYILSLIASPAQSSIQYSYDSGYKVVNANTEYNVIIHSTNGNAVNPAEYNLTVIEYSGGIISHTYHNRTDFTTGPKTDHIKVTITSQPALEIDMIMMLSLSDFTANSTKNAQIQTNVENPQQTTSSTPTTTSGMTLILVIMGLTSIFIVKKKFH